MRRGAQKGRRLHAAASFRRSRKVGRPVPLARSCSTTTDERAPGRGCLADRHKPTSLHLPCAGADISISLCRFPPTPAAPCPRPSLGSFWIRGAKAAELESAWRRGRAIVPQQWHHADCTGRRRRVAAGPLKAEDHVKVTEWQLSNCPLSSRRHHSARTCNSTGLQRGEELGSTSRSRTRATVGSVRSQVWWRQQSRSSF